MKRRIFFLAFLFVITFSIFIDSSVSASSIDSCQISADHGSIKIDVTVNPVNTDDSKIYLFAQNVYDNNLSSPIQVSEYGKSQTKYTFYVPFTDGTLLYKKYIVAVKKGGKYVTVTDYRYVTNPEIIATYNNPKLVARTKKGTSTSTAALIDLNCDNGFLNIMYEELIGGFEPGNKVSSEYDFYYNGYTYYINSAKLVELDEIIGKMTQNNIVVTVSLNAGTNKNSTYGKFLCSPSATETSGVVHYGFNTENELGQNMITALTLFLANRYSDANSHGVISNYLIGNEVNDEYTYYNIGAKSFDDFTERYMRTFRVMYNAIRSTNSTSDVYMTLAHFWYWDEDLVRNTPAKQKDVFPCRVFIDKFNDLAIRQGNFNWGIAFHPYSYPLDEASVYDDDDGELTYLDRNNERQKYVSDSEKSYIVTMKNIEVLTNYMHKSQLLNTSSQVRSIILTEQGYMSTTKGKKDELMQAASIIYAYYKTESLKDVDQFILFRYRDDPALVNEPYGLLNVDGSKKYSYDIYKNLNSSNSFDYSKFALNIFGISSWNDIFLSPTGTGKFTDYITNNMPDRKSNSFIRVDTMLDYTLIENNYMDSNWEMTYNMMTMTNASYPSDGGYATYYSMDCPYLDSWDDLWNNNWAVTSDCASNGENKIITKRFETPLDLSSEPYFGFLFELDSDADYYAHNPSKTPATQANLIVKLYSTNGDIFEATTNVSIGREFYSSPYNLYMDLRSWKGRNSIKKVEVEILEKDGTFPQVEEISILKMNKVASVEGTELPTLEPEKIDISSGSISAIGAQEYTESRINPNFSVNFDGNILTPNVDYIYAFENNKFPGTATLTVVGIGDYTGTLSTTFKINTPTFKVTFDSKSFGTASFMSKNVKYGETYGELPVINNPQMAFLGWYTSEAGGTRITSSSIVNIKSNITLHAQYYAPISKDGYSVAYRDPTALNYSPVFNPIEYWEMNPDVKADATFGSSYDLAFVHFLNFGMPEGRVGSSNFNVIKYRYCITNADLRRALGGDIKQYYIHYVAHGQHEGRSKSEWDGIFDADYYLNVNPDVKTYLINKFTSDGNLKGWCLWHYCEFGANEGRLANAEFSVLNYASANPDVFRAYTQYTSNGIKTDFKEIAVHYLLYGRKEGRKIVNGKYNINHLPSLRPDVVSVLGSTNLAGWVDWYINFGSKGM